MTARRRHRRPSTWTSDEGSAQGCNGMPANVSRWCIGGSPTNNIRVVTGIPNGWSPLGGAPISGGARRRHPHPGAGRDEHRQHRRFGPLARCGTTRNSAKTIGDASVAYYQNCSLIFFPCPSLDRAIRVRNMSPAVTGPPIDDPGYPKGRLYVSVSYGPAHRSTPPRSRSPRSATSRVRRTAAPTTFPSRCTAVPGGLATYTFTDVQAKQLADSCGSIDLINGFEYTLKTKGNFFNCGQPQGVARRGAPQLRQLPGSQLPQSRPRAGFGRGGAIGL